MEWVRRSVRDFWAAEHAGGAARLADALLAPAEAPFRAAVAARNAWHDRRPPAATPVPVVSVGNLSVGGTGKTPVVRWLAEWLQRTGARPAIVARGYGQDELALYRRWFGARAVFADRDRARCVRRAAERGFTVAVLDDGFQHRRLARALDIVLVAAEDPLRARMLPRGPYREPPAAAARATMALLTHRTPSGGAGGRRGGAGAGAAAVESREAGAGPEAAGCEGARAEAARRKAAWRERLARVAPNVPVLDLEIRMGGWTELDGGPCAPPEGDVLAVCAIARPGPFASGLRALLPSARIEQLAYADHHDYGRRDVSAMLRRLGGRTLVCTAKDAVKLAAWPELARRCAVVGFEVVGDPDEPLRRALAEVAAT